MEDFVPFKLAQKLQEKGLILEETEIYGIFDSDGLFHSQLYFNYIETMDCDEIVAPTISQILKWLRKEKKIHIGFGYSPRKKWRYVVMYMDDRFYNRATLAVDGFLKIEQAALAGIEYVLDNLI